MSYLIQSLNIVSYQIGLSVVAINEVAWMNSTPTIGPWCSVCDFYILPVRTLNETRQVVIYSDIRKIELFESEEMNGVYFPPSLRSLSQWLCLCAFLLIRWRNAEEIVNQMMIIMFPATPNLASFELQ